MTWHRDKRNKNSTYSVISQQTHAQSSFIVKIQSTHNINNTPKLLKIQVTNNKTYHNRVIA